MILKAALIKASINVFKNNPLQLYCHPAFCRSSFCCHSAFQTSLHLPGSCRAAAKSLTFSLFCLAFVSQPHSLSELPERTLQIVGQCQADYDCEIDCFFPSRKPAIVPSVTVCLLVLQPIYHWLGTGRPENCQIMAEPGRLHYPWENTCQLLCTARSSVSKMTRKAIESREESQFVAVRKQVGQKQLLALPISVSLGSCLVFGPFGCVSLVGWGVFCESSDFNHIFAAVLSYAGPPFPRMDG